MRSIGLCVPFHPTEVLILNDDNCADLVNQFGWKLIRIIFSPVKLSSSVLERAKRGGHIRWHTLAAGQTELSSDYRDECLWTYSIRVWVKESMLGVVPDTLDESELREFVVALGVDLDKIRKLCLDQVVLVCQWLQDAGIIERFEVQENQPISEMNPVDSLGNYNTDTSLRTTPAFIDPSLLTSDHTLSSLGNFSSGDEFGSLWEQFIASPEDQITADSASPEHVATPMSLKPNTIDYPTPPHSVGSPQKDWTVAPTSSGDKIMRYQSVSTPLSTGSPCISPTATPIGPATPFKSDANSSFYPTLSSPYVNSPPGVESHLPLTLNISRQRKMRCLQLCRFGTDESELLTQDPLRLLQPFIERSETDLSPFLYAFGLPVQWTGEEAAVTYYKLLEAVKLKNLVLDRTAKRIAQILFYLNYTWLEKHGKLGQDSVAGFILNACPGELIKPKSRKSRLDNITSLHKRQGNRCWMLAACLGIGILLHGGDAIETIINSNLNNAELNIFISFVLRTRPGTVRLLHSLEPMIKAIMLGEAAVHLRPAILAGNAIVRQEQLAFAYKADQEAWTNQANEEIWQAIDAEAIAKQRISEILPGF